MKHPRPSPRPVSVDTEPCGRGHWFPPAGATDHEPTGGILYLGAWRLVIGRDGEDAGDPRLTACWTHVESDAPPLRTLVGDA